MGPSLGDMLLSSWENRFVVSGEQCLSSFCCCTWCGVSAKREYAEVLPFYAYGHCTCTLTLDGTNFGLGHAKKLCALNLQTCVCVWVSVLRGRAVNCMIIAGILSASGSSALRSPVLFCKPASLQFAKVSCVVSGPAFWLGCSALSKRQHLVLYGKLTFMFQYGACVVEMYQRFGSLFCTWKNSSGGNSLNSFVYNSSWCSSSCLLNSFVDDNSAHGCRVSRKNIW